MIGWTASTLKYTNDFTIKDCWAWVEHELEFLWLSEPPKLDEEEVTL